MADVKVRQAVNYAINKEAIVNDVLEGTADVAAGRLHVLIGVALTAPAEFTVLRLTARTAVAP